MLLRVTARAYLPLGLRDEFLIDVTLTLLTFIRFTVDPLLFFNRLSLLRCECKTGILDGLVRVATGNDDGDDDDDDDEDDEDVGGGGVDDVLNFRMEIGTGISDVC